MKNFYSLDICPVVVSVNINIYLRIRFHLYFSIRRSLLLCNKKKRTFTIFFSDGYVQYLSKNMTPIRVAFIFAIL